MMTCGLLLGGQAYGDPIESQALRREEIRAISNRPVIPVFDYGPYVKPRKWVSGVRSASSSQTGRRNAMNGSIPQKWDSRELGLISPPPDQGKNGWCWAYAAIGAMEASLRKKGYKDPVLSPASLVKAVFNDPDRSKRFLAPTAAYGDGRGGDDPMAASQSGSNLLSTAAVLARLSPVSMPSSSLPAVRVKRISRIATTNESSKARRQRPNITAIKKTVLREGAAVVSYDGAPSWYEKTQDLQAML